MNTLIGNLKWGLKGALGVATFFSLFVLLMLPFRSTDVRDQYGVSVWVIIATYFVAALIGGIVVGALRPLTHHWAGAGAVGIIVGILA